MSKREPTNHPPRWAGCEWTRKEMGSRNLRTFSHLSCVSWADFVLRVDRRADVTVLHQPVVVAMSTNPIPNEAAAFKFANGTIMNAYAHTPFAATNFLSNGCSSDLQKAAKETKIFFNTGTLKRSLGIAGVFRSR
jgi:hypothetical protein